MSLGGYRTTDPNADPGTDKRQRTDKSSTLTATQSEEQTTQALKSLLTNPIFVQALASAASTSPTSASNPTSTSQPVDSSNTQRQNRDMTPTQSDTHGSAHRHHQQQAPPTPFQQTRSGRISRPPIAPQYNLLQALASEFGTPNFESLLKAASYSIPNGANVSSANAGSGSSRTIPAGGYDTGSNGRPGRERCSTTPDDEGDSHLPDWPLPPSGPGGRRAMPKEEILARRRARNRVAAVESRRRKRQKFDVLEDELKDKNKAYEALEAHCKRLEQQVEQLQQIIVNAGLVVPTPLPMPTVQHTQHPVQSMDISSMVPDYNFPLSSAFDTPATDTPGTISGNELHTFPNFDMFFNVDIDGEDDGDFLPPTSPGADSDNDDGPSPSTSAVPGTRKGKEKATPGGTGRSEGGKRRDPGHEEDEDEFEDDDVEDEDLFLPIEDVPVPPDVQMDSAMRSLGVDNQEQLASLINRMVGAGKEGMTSDMVDKLRVLVSLVGPEAGASASL